MSFLRRQESIIKFKITEKTKNNTTQNWKPFSKYGTHPITATNT